MNGFESMSISPISVTSGKGIIHNGGQTTTPSNNRSCQVDSGKYLPRVSSSKNTTHDSLDVTHDRQITNDSLELSSAKHLQRSLTTVRRKDTARRQLMCSMYSKHNSVKRSFSFVAGERPTDLKFPSVSYREEEPKWTKEKKERINRKVSKTSANTSPELKYVTFVSKETPTMSHSRTSNRSSCNKVNLPEIIMDFNMESVEFQNGRRGTMVTSSDESDDEERAIGAPYEDYLKRTKLLSNNPCRARHRPVTPGLLESLNKLRLPSKIRTEQWLKSVANTRRSYCDNNYTVGNLVNSNLAFPNWIYTDT